MIAGLPILQLIPFIMKILYGTGLVKDVETEREIKLKLIELAARKDIAESEEFKAFLQATSPNPAYVWPWVNSVQALTRPAITWIIMISIITAFWIPSLANQIASTLKAFADSGPVGLLFIAIPAWWFFGRSIERMVPGLAMLKGESVEYEGGAAGRVKTQPNGAPSGPTPSPRYRAEKPEIEQPDNMTERNFDIWYAPRPYEPEVMGDR